MNTASQSKCYSAKVTARTAHQKRGDMSYLDPILSGEAYKKLSSREQKVMFFLLGLDGKKPMTIKQIAKVYECTPYRIQQIANKAMEKMATVVREDREKTFELLNR